VPPLGLQAAVEAGLSSRPGSGDNTPAPALSRRSSLDFSNGNWQLQQQQQQQEQEAPWLARLLSKQVRRRKRRRRRICQDV
jgi:hypothetical protein